MCSGSGLLRHANLKFTISPSSSSIYFFLKLQEKLGNGFECFDALDNLGKSSGSELWEEHFDSLLRLLRIIIIHLGGAEN